MAERKTLTEKGIASALARLKPGTQIEIADKIVPGFGIRNRTYYLVACYQKGGNPTRRALGRVGEITLEVARSKALTWKAALRAGLDPAIEQKRRELAEARQRNITFEAVAEEFIREILPRERKAKEVARDIRRDLVALLGARPIADIERIDIREIIKAKRTQAPAQARNLLGYAKRVFSWAVDQDVYGLKSSPCADIRAKEIIGERPISQRTLSDSEIFAFWRAAKREAYPYRDIYQLLLLNGLRLNEVADAVWSEFDFSKREWIIPAKRMKGKESKARPHVVPLTDESLQILGRLPGLSNGPFLFSCTFGKSPVWMNSKIKKRLDANMLLILKAIARKQGNSPAEVKLEHWVNHDLRRTLRTGLSPLKNDRGVRVADEVKEAVLAHARSGIKGVYDRYDYFDEKLEALQLWAARLSEIAEGKKQPLPNNVIPYARKVS